jgi:RNase P protein component
MAPPRVDDLMIWEEAPTLNAKEFRAVAARRLAMGNAVDRNVLRRWLLKVADDNRELIERLRDYGGE